MRLVTKRLARAITIAAAIVASSGTLQANGQPLLATLGEVAFNLAAVLSEVEKVRGKIDRRQAAEIMEATFAKMRTE